MYVSLVYDVWLLAMQAMQANDKQNTSCFIWTPLCHVYIAH